MRYDAARLTTLLPAIYRLRDEQTGDLRALLAVLAEQIGVVEENLEQLYDDQFIDTCADWVIPYIGALLGNTPLFDGGRDADAEPRLLFPDLAGPSFVPRVALRGRPDVAKTIHYRARKATRAMLEELAADVTGWEAHVVEFFQLLGWSQCVRNHLRLFSKRSPDVRRDEITQRLNGPFDEISHAVDVRAPAQREGWYETRNIGFFLWRLRSYGLTEVLARPEPTVAYGFHANPLGIDAPLFSRAERDDGTTSGTLEVHVPGPMRRLKLRDDLLLGDKSALYGLDRSLFIHTDTEDIPANRICSCDLTHWRQPAGNIVAVDVTTGRIAFGDGMKVPPEVRVTFQYGFAADLGGGPYPRQAWLLGRDDATTVLRVTKSGPYKTIGDALDAWRAHTPPKPKAVIALGDDDTYHETKQLVLDPDAGSSLVIQADDHARPHIRLDYPLQIECGDEATVTLSGLLVEGTIEVDRLAGTLRVLHTTLAPATGTPSIAAPATVIAATTVNTFTLLGAFSITGGLRLPPDCRGITLLDSIIDGGTGAAIRGVLPGTAAPPLQVERCTVFGSVSVRALPLASETIFTGILAVERRQEGCARFCFIPDGSTPPRPYRCQPDLEVRTRIAAEEQKRNARLSKAEQDAIRAAVVAFLAPIFTSSQYGDPGYAQLHLSAPLQIAQGAEDGSEMGVFCHLKQPQRAGNLSRRLEEYLPFGLQPAIIFVT